MAIDFSKTNASPAKAKTSASSKPKKKKKNAEKIDWLNADISTLRSGTAIKASHRKFFTEQLALLLETGNTLHMSLELLQSQTDYAPLRDLIEDLHARVTKGVSFASALRQHPKVFSATYTTLVEAGEAGGYLPRVLTHLVEMEEKREELRSMVTSAFFYPVMLILFSLLVVVFVLTVIFPKFLPLFESSGASLPLSTQVLMTSSNLVMHYWWAILAVIGGIGFYVHRSLSNPVKRAKFDAMILSMPFMGTLSVQINLTHMMRLLHLSLQNGVSLIDALRVSKDASKNIAFREFVEVLIKNVSEGKGLGVGFRQASFIPHLIKQMIQTGEESGKLELVTGRVADFYQRELSRKLSTLSKIVEPVMLLGMGVFIAFIVSALVLPIFRISSAVN